MAEFDVETPSWISQAAGSNPGPPFSVTGFLSGTACPSVPLPFLLGVCPITAQHPSSADPLFYLPPDGSRRGGTGPFPAAYHIDMLTKGLPFASVYLRYKDIIVMKSDDQTLEFGIG